MTEKSARGLSELQELQSEKIARQVIDELRENLVCQNHCAERHYKINHKLLILFILSGVGLSGTFGIKILPYILRAF